MEKMNLIDAIIYRRSTREFTDHHVDQALLDTLVFMAYKTPSAGNLRPLEMYVAKFPKPPDYIIISADFSKTAAKYHEHAPRYVYMEAGHAAQNICLLATAMGLGSCCVGAFDGPKIKTQYKLEFEPIYMVAIGYPR